MVGCLRFLVAEGLILDGALRGTEEMQRRGRGEDTWYRCLVGESWWKGGARCVGGRMIRSWQFSSGFLLEERKKGKKETKTKHNN